MIAAAILLAATIALLTAAVWWQHRHRPIGEWPPRNHPR